MATAYQRDQWRLIESTDSGAESGSEEVATPADPAEPWKVRGTEYIFVPKGLCRAVNSDQAPLTNVVGRPQVMDESLQKLLGRWKDRSLKGEKMHVRYDELNLEDFVNATKPL